MGKKKTLAPLFDVLQKYQSDITPYLEAFTKAMRGGALTLTGDVPSKIEEKVADWLNEGVELLQEAQKALGKNDTRGVLEYWRGRRHKGHRLSASEELAADEYY